MVTSFFWEDNKIDNKIYKNLLIIYLGTLEEHHLSAEHPLERVAGEGLGGDALGDVVAVLVAAAEPRAPLGVRHDLGLGQVKLLHLGHVLGVLLDVDLQLGGQQVHLGHHAGQVPDLGRHVALVVSEVFEELNKVILVDLDEAGGGVGRPLVPPQGGQLVNIFVSLQQEENEPIFSF